MRGHLPDDVLGEGLRTPGRADEDGRAHPAYDLGEAGTAVLGIDVPRRHLVDGPRERLLEVAQVGSGVGEQAVPADAPELAGGDVLRHAGDDHRVADLVRDADARGAGAVDDDAVLRERDAADVARGQDGCEAHGPGALHVVVEGECLVAVAVEDAARVRRAEVLPVQDRVGEERGRRGDVAVDEGVVLLAPDPRLRHAEVERVVEQLLPVGADVEHHGKGAGRVDAGRRGVDVELADGDLDAADAPVPDAEDALGVGSDDEVDVIGRATGREQRVLHAVRVVDRQVDAARAAVLVAVALDRLADRGRVDDREHLGQVPAEQPEEEHLVAVVQRGEEDVLREVGGLVEVLQVGAALLLLQREHARGQQADEAEPLALLGAERRPLVEPRLGQDRATAQRGLPRVGVGVPVDDVLGLGRRGHPSTVGRSGGGGAASGRDPADTLGGITAQRRPLLLAGDVPRRPPRRRGPPTPSPRS